MKTELLAPARDKETAFAAIDCGADAVYIGASGYGARQKASNSLEDIKEVINYAHKFFVKVYVTVNTVLTDSELSSAVELVKALDKLGADGILIQDMGLLSKLIDLHLSIPIHASTQCDNREPEKIRFFSDSGLSRVVLARELSLEQIKKIHDSNPEIELEAFVHGALCVSYSGQCYLSQYIGGRSANRGECAQPCRKKYSVLNQKEEYLARDIYALCLKDFNASKYLKQMAEAGIYSFKIEGRLKSVGYVKNVVAYYRQLLDKFSEKSSAGKCFYPFIPEVKRSFNRGFTDYFLNGRTDCFNFVSPKSRGKYVGTVKSVKNNVITLETDYEISPQDGMCFETKSGENIVLEGFLVNKAEKVKDGFLIYSNKKINLKKGTKLYRNLDVKFEKELLLPVKRQIGVSVLVKDNTVYLKDEDGITESAGIPSNEIAKNPQKMKETFIKQFSKSGDFYIKDMKIEQDIPFMPVSEVNELRRNILSKLAVKRIKTYKRPEQKPLKAVSYYKKDLDYRANVTNKEAEKFYEHAGAKVKEYCNTLPERQIELMRTKHCIKYALNMCKAPQTLILEDEKGVKYPLLFDCKKCEMAVLSPKVH